MSSTSSRYSTIALVGKFDRSDVSEPISQIAAHLLQSGRTVLIAEHTGVDLNLPNASNVEVVSFETIGKRADLAIVVGGDGTLLVSARKLAPYGVPLVGVNRGRLGFLTDLSAATACEAITRLLQGEFSSERRQMLDVRVERAGETVFRGLALNDVVLQKGDAGRMIEFGVHIDNEFVYDQRSDGLIVATPTGSTAYALSANGPIIHPGVGGIALVPLCSHTLTNRPITLPETARIAIRLFAPHVARVHCDGQERFDVQADDQVMIERSRHCLNLLHPPEYSYFAMLREKLRWSEAPRER